MAINDLTPGFVKWYITTTEGFVTMTLPVQAIDTFDDDPAVAALEAKATVTWTFQQCVDNLWAELRPYYTALSETSLVELWSQPLPTDVPVLVTDTAPAAPAGSGGGSESRFGVITFTYRATNQSRGVFKLSHPIVSIFAEGKFQRWSDNTGLLTVEQQLRDWFASSENWIATRGDGWYRTPLNVSHKSSDALRRRAMRTGEIPA